MCRNGIEVHERIGVTGRRPINVLFIHANNVDIGGSDYCLFKLVTTLDRNKFNPIVLLALDTEIAAGYRKYGTPVLIMPMRRIRRTRNPWRHLLFFADFFPTVLRIAGIIKEYDIQLVHSNDFQDIYGAVAARITGTKGIQHIRLIVPRRNLLRELWNRCILISNHRVVTVSDAVGQEMFTVGGKVHPKVTTCYDWLDMERVGHVGNNERNFRKESGIPDGATLIGVVGRLERWKGQHVFIKAAADVARRHPEACFAVVGGKVYGRGREMYESELKALAQRLGILDRVIFAGHRKDLANVMNSLDLYAHSSVDPDPLPGVVMEAMSMAKPVVGPRAGGIPEEVEDGKTGILYEPGDHHEMAEAMCRLIEDPKLAHRMGQAGKERVQRVFNRDILCKRLESLYEEVIGDGH